MSPAAPCAIREGHGHPGVIHRFLDRLPFAASDPIVTLQEGSTPLVLAERLSERAGAEVFLKIEGANPTGSFKDRGMCCAVTAARREGAETVICASTGNTAASAVLGDLVSAMIPPASTPEPSATLPVVADVESSFYLHLEVADRPGVLAQIAQLLGLQGASVRSVVQKGLGDNARLVMVVHPLLESRFYAAVELIAGLDFVRSKPRAIRVIEEEYQ